MKVIDDVVTEPPGGAHRDPARAAEGLGRALRKHLAQLQKLSGDQLVTDRYKRFRALGVFSGK